MLESLRASCLSFLASEFGAPGKKGMPSGLHTVALGNPELAVQGALVGYLRYVEKLNAVQECGLTDGRDVDVIVFDDRWRPLCAIELKHRMSNQGPFRQLLKNLDADRLKHAGSAAAELPLLQIGLYTEIASRPELAGQHGLYRFLCAGYFQGSPRHRPENLEPADPMLHAPDYITIEVAGQSVTGRVAYYLRTINPQERVPT